MKRKLQANTEARVVGILERMAAAGKLETKDERPEALRSKAQIRLELQVLEMKLSKTLQEGCDASRRFDWGLGQDGRTANPQTAKKANRCLEEVSYLLERMRQLTEELQALGRKSFLKRRKSSKKSKC